MATDGGDWVASTLLNPEAVRRAAHELLEHGLEGQLSAFTLDLSRLAPTADFVSETIRANYPDLNVPFHARWRHFCAGGRDLWSEAYPNSGDRLERSRAAFDLAIVSVLLDAGAGMGWRFRDPVAGVTSRSEGLALASLRMFEAGAFSNDPRAPLRADASRLQAITPADIAAGFQADDSNPLVGLEGRASLLNALGRTVSALPGARPGGLFDLLLGEVAFHQLPARAILMAVLRRLGAIWPSRLALAGIPLGDTWQHPLATGTRGYVPFHKLSQWLSYSLIEPLQWAGVDVTEIDGLTGLPEYRNGGLFVDLGVLTLRDPAAATAGNTVDSRLVVEWRALTVALLDRIAPLVRERLGLREEDFPLARVLEGGTWSAGRRVAARLRADGGPPIRVVSDGTVF